ncbi:MAG: sodium:proton antiporter [Clostridiaceae bacterium]|nr:sodium:proton antiporter [Clostridiaceae bacterium]
MPLVCNFPFFSIVLSMFSGIISSVLNGKTAKKLSVALLCVNLSLSASVLAYTLATGQSYVYMMGHFPAPWGNEIRAGVLEGVLATFFCIIMLLALVGGLRHIASEIEESKQNLYFIMVDLLLASLLALIYTNDLFTAYVFVEINTIAACGMIMIRHTGRSYVAAARYMVMSLLGSGLFLISLSTLYGLTGQLLMTPAQQAVASLRSAGLYMEPLTVTIALMTVGLAIKSGLYPFHSWMPETYGYSTAPSAAILSSLVSKGYIILLIKIYYRVLGSDTIMHGKISNLLFVFGLAGMIMGSLSAIRESDIRRMIAFSSVAQIGYIYMGLGLGTEAGVIASLFHILSHAASKGLLFISATGLSDVSGRSRHFKDLRGAGYRNPVAAAGFTVGAVSMVGLPLFAGFISKLLFATAGVQDPTKMLPTLICLAVSTVLNTVYFLRTVMTIFTPVDAGTESKAKAREITRGFSLKLSVLCFIILNLVLGLFSDPIVSALEQGLHMFS